MTDIDLVIFDKDGTLIDVHYYWYGMIELRAKMLSRNYIKPQYQEEATKKLMANMGINLKTRKIKLTGPVGIKPREFIIDIAYKVTKQYYRPITVEQVSSVFKEIDNYSKDHLHKLVRPLIGVDQLLTLLKKKKIKVAIATTDLTNRAKLAMDSISLTHYFDYIAGADLVTKAKPSPDLVNFLCNKMSIDKNKTLVIGDSIVDFNMAKLAGVNFIGVKTGLCSSEFVKRTEILIHNLTYMNKLL